VIVGLVPFEPKRVKTAATPTLLQLPIIALPLLTKKEFEALRVFHKIAVERGIPFHDKLAIDDLIIELLARLDIEADTQIPLIQTLSRYAQVDSLLKDAPTINMDLTNTQQLLLRSLYIVAHTTDLSKIHPVELYGWVITKIHDLKIPEKDHISMYQCSKRYVYNKTYKPEIPPQIQDPVDPASIEESIMQDLARIKDRSLLDTGSVRELERWIDDKMTFYGLPPEKRESISKRIHDRILEYRASCIGYIKWTSGAGGVKAPLL
jgi:hypothetical protein